MNEAWILSDNRGATPAPTGLGKVVHSKETYPDGKLKAVWAGKIEPDGRYELDGLETWYYASGAKAYQVDYRDGSKIGIETYWSPQGCKIWQWNHRASGESVWTHYWPSGRKRQQSEWNNNVANGPAILWDKSGHVTGQYEFKNGIISGKPEN